MPPERYNWHFFIAHAGADKRTAEELYNHVKPKSRVFLDSRNLMLGDDWDTELRKAQQKSLVTVVLISSKTEAAYYQREEIAAAIALARENAEKHRVVPVFLSRQAQNNNSVPYGLRLKHGLTVSRQLSLKAVGERLLDLLSHLVKDAGHGQELVSMTTDRKSKETSSRPVKYGPPGDLIDFEDQRLLFKSMLADSPEKRLMFIQAPGGRGKTSLLRMFGFHCEREEIPYCSIAFGDQPYDKPHFTLAHAICNQFNLSPRHLAHAVQGLSISKPQDVDDSNISEILDGVSVTHEGLNQRYMKERLRDAFISDIHQLVEQKGPTVCLFDGFDSLSAEEEDWLLDALLWPVSRGQLQHVMIVTAGRRWPRINEWEWGQNAYLVDGLPKMNPEHIKLYAEKLNLKITDEEANIYWKASARGTPLHMALVVRNVRLSEMG
jgi:TIR domain-containing protein